MTTKETIDKIKVLLGLAPEAPAPAPVGPAPAALTAYKLADGTDVEISELAVGGIVTVGGAPAPEGEHILEDGTKIEVDGAGVITEISAAEPMAPEAPAPDPMAMAEQRFAAVEATLKSQGEMIASFDAALKSNAEVVKQLLGVVEQLANAPTADPVEPQRFTKVEPETKADKYAALRQNIDNLKKK